MSISKAYNHKSGVYYAYETTYEWSEEKQKKIAVRKCVGHFDPVTNEIVPNGKRGRKSVYPRIDPSDPSARLKSSKSEQHTGDNDYEYLAEMFQKITDICADAVTFFEDKAKNIAE